MRSRRLAPFLPAAALLLTSCVSVKQLAVNRVADALAAGGDTFASDDDPELVKQAVPFSLKLMESILAESPRHEGLLLGACSGFTQYAVAFVQQDADALAASDYAASEALRLRAQKLYRRGRDYGVRGLEVAYPGIAGRLAHDPKAALAVAGRKDVPLLYWTAAAWGSLISTSKDNPAAISELPQVEALVDRAFALDPDWNQGALHALLISLEMNRTGAPGNAAERARAHYERALALSHGSQAGPLVTFAESVAVDQQDAAAFENALNQALAIDVDQYPKDRLANLVMQRRARWLLSQKADLFFETTP